MTEGLTLSLSLSVGKFCMTHGMAKKNPPHTHVYSLLVLEARSLKSVPLDQHQDGGSPTCTPEALEESSFLVSSRFCGCQHFLACGHITTISTSIFIPLYVCVCVCVCEKSPFARPSYKNRYDCIEGPPG